MCFESSELCTSEVLTQSVKAVSATSYSFLQAFCSRERETSLICDYLARCHNKQFTLRIGVLDVDDTRVTEQTDQ